MKKTIIGVWVFLVTVETAFRGAEVTLRIVRRVREMQKEAHG